MAQRRPRQCRDDCCTERDDCPNGEDRRDTGRFGDSPGGEVPDRKESNRGEDVETMYSTTKPRRDTELNERVCRRVVSDLAGSEHGQGHDGQRHESRCRENKHRDCDRPEPNQEHAPAPT